MMRKLVDISSYRRSKRNGRSTGNASTLLISSIDHVNIGANRRGFLLKADPHRARFFSILNIGNALVGTCQFSENGLLEAYSLVNPEDGKYVTRDTERNDCTPATLTSMLLEELVRL